MKKIYLIILIFWCLLISCSKMSTGEKGEQYYEKGDFKKAEEYFLKAVKKSKDNIAMNYLGSLYAKQEKYELAEKYWKMAIDNNNREAYFNLGNLYIELKKYDLAEQYYKLIEENNKIETLHELGVVLHNLGVINEKKGDYIQAKEYYKKAFENGYAESKQPLRDIEGMGY